jgi:TolB protein
VDGHPVWSTDGKWILFSSKRGGAYALWRVSPRGDAPRRITYGTGPEQDPSLDAQGTRLIYSTWTRDRDVVHLDLTTGERTRLPSASIESSPVISPDGRSIAFVSDRRGVFDLWIQELRNGQPNGPPRRLTDHPGSVATPCFSADGKWLAYHRVVPGAQVQRDIWTVPASGGAPAQSTDHAAADTNPVYSPDGNRLAFISDRGGRSHVWVSELSEGRPVGNPVQITKGNQSDALPAWSGDGGLLAFLRDGDVWLVPPDGKTPAKRLTQGAVAQMAKWSNSGKTLFVAGTWGERQTHLRLVRTEDGRGEIVTPLVVFGDSSAPGLFGVSRDGKYVAYIETVSGGDLWIMEAGGGG